LIPTDLFTSYIFLFGKYYIFHQNNLSKISILQDKPNLEDNKFIVIKLKGRVIYLLEYFTEIAECIESHKL